MDFITAYSTKESIADAVNDISTKFAGNSPETILYFASTIYDPSGIAEEMQNVFNAAKVFGCTTSGELADGRMLKNSLVAIAFGPGAIEDIDIQVVENLNEKESLDNTFLAFEKYYEMPVSEMDFEDYVGMILIDGLSMAEEKTMDSIGDRTNVLFIGGSAGDDLTFSKTHVFANGKAYSGAAVLTLIKPGRKFDFIKTQSFRALDKILVATKVNEESREIIEFNGKPAIEAYAEAVGTTVDEAPGSFMKNPTGIVIGDDIFVRSPQRVEGTHMFFFCNVREGTELSLLESTDIVGDTKAAVDAKVKEMGGFSALINFNCILRTLELEASGMADEYGAVFEGLPAIGFSTYGEEYIGHINQTATMLVFK